MKEKHLTEKCKSFHLANIQNLITKTLSGERNLFIKDQEKMHFLRELCTEEKPYFLAFAETHLKEEIKDAEFSIKGYSHEAGHRLDRSGGGVIIYISNKQYL